MHPPAYLSLIASKGRLFRVLGGVFFAISTCGLICLLGLASGIFASIVVLMCAGCVSVSLFPLNVLKGNVLIGAYVSFLVLEFILN